MQNVIEAKDALGRMAYVKFMPDTGHNMRAFGDASLPDVQIVTLIRFQDGWWRVWGISRNHFPVASEVFM